jgi:penicillin-binding protein 1C
LISFFKPFFKKAASRPRLLVAVTLPIFLLSLFWIIPLPERLATPPSTVVRFSDRSTGFVFLSADEKWRIKADLSRIDSDYKDALIAYEDRRFYFHPGIDPVAIVRATMQNLIGGKIVSGASTLTMQLVRVLEPRRRSFGSKFFEAFRALQLELRMSKKEILAAYMTYISFGKNIEGVETASWAYFGHGASSLSPAEIAVLLSVPQLPSKRFPDPKHALKLVQSRDKILRQMYKKEVFSKSHEPLETVLASEVPKYLKPFPRDAAHLAYWLQQAGTAIGTSGDIFTTIDPAVQKLLTNLSSREGRRAADQGVHNHAAIVVETATGEVKAIVGGIDFWNRRPGSQIAGFQIPRSPGSLLKPFIYAQALDLGMIIPDRLITDIPTNYGGYTPKNFDSNFNGLIRVEDALARSLNIPFVSLLQQIGIERFLGTLSQFGITRIQKSPGHYGLSVAAGGIELTALEVAGLYTSLARDGSHIPLRWLSQGEVNQLPHAMQIYSPGATWLTRKALRLRDRPDFPRRRDFTKVPTDVFWKTGTSFGHRDAWAAGSSGKYTAVVWFGNVDYAPSHALVGADMAAPLLFDILENLNDANQPANDDKPRAVGEVEVCSFSGHLPSHACPHKRLVSALIHNLPHENCPYHTEMEIETKSGLAVGPTCRAGRVTEKATFMNWPQGVRRYMSTANRYLPDLPKIHPACVHIAKDEELRIVSPAKNKVMMLIPGLDPKKQEMSFEVEGHSGTEEVSWFLNGRFLKTVRIDEQVWWVPEKGEFELTAVTSNGRSAMQKFRVSSLN